jgi:predicted ArsR family transcriptional regulator
MTDETLDRLAPLADPVRRALYAYVAEQPGPVDRDAAAAATGIGRPLAAFHLDRLAAAGLLEVEYHRRSGRTGPGAGRPAKFYRRARGPEIAVSFPPRHYDELAEILVTGLERSRAGANAARAAARERGEAIAASVTPPDRPTFLETIAEHGYEPVERGDTVELRNCPFDRLAAGHRQVTCSLNRSMLGAATDGVPGADLRAVAVAPEGTCCVALVPRSEAASA